MYLDSAYQSTQLTWSLFLLSDIIGLSIVLWKYTQPVNQLKLLIFLDIIFICQYYLFCLWSIPYSLNYLISIIIGLTLIYISSLFELRKHTILGGLKMKKIIFIDFPVIWLLSNIIWHFLIANNGFEGFETGATLLAFYYLGWSIYFYFFKNQRDQSNRET